jgi:hypothetical protein
MTLSPCAGLGRAGVLFPYAGQEPADFRRNVAERRGLIRKREWAPVENPKHGWTPAMDRILLLMIELGGRSTDAGMALDRQPSTCRTRARLLGMVLRV